MKNTAMADLIRQSPEEVYGHDMTELLAMPFETEPVLEDGKDLTKIRHNAARSDMKLARKEKVICISGAKNGNIELFYDADTKLYSASNFNTGVKFFTNYNAMATRTFLANCYIVE